MHGVFPGGLVPALRRACRGKLLDNDPTPQQTDFGFLDHEKHEG